MRVTTTPEACPPLPHLEITHACCCAGVFPQTWQRLTKHFPSCCFPHAVAVAYGTAAAALCCGNLVLTAHGTLCLCAPAPYLALRVMAAARVSRMACLPMACAASHLSISLPSLTSILLSLMAVCASAYTTSIPSSLDISHGSMHRHLPAMPFTTCCLISCATAFLPTVQPYSAHLLAFWLHACVLYPLLPSCPCVCATCAVERFGQELPLLPSYFTTCSLSLDRNIIYVRKLKVDMAWNATHTFLFALSVMPNMPASFPTTMSHYYPSTTIPTTTTTTYLPTPSHLPPPHTHTPPPPPLLLSFCAFAHTMPTCLSCTENFALFGDRTGGPLTLCVGVVVCVMCVRRAWLWRQVGGGGGWAEADTCCHTLRAFPP